MINTVTAATRREREARLRPECTPGDERQHRRRDHRRHEPAGHLIGQTLNRGSRTLCPRDRIDDPRQHGVTPHLIGAQHQSAALVDGTRDHARAFGFGDRHRFAGHHGFVDRGTALDDEAVDRDLLAGAYPQPIAGRDRIDSDVLIAMPGDAPGGFRGKPEQRTNGSGGALARPQFQHLPEQDQHRDDGRRLEIHRDRAVHVPERRWKKLRRQRAHHAVDVGHTGTHRDQREHVQLAVHHRAPAARKEWRARPQHHGSGERKRNPVRPCRGMRQAEMAAHLDREHRKRQHQRDPEPPGHVPELGVGRIVERDLLGLQRHAAHRARAGADLPHFRMHRACINGARRSRRLGLLRLQDIFPARLRSARGSAARRNNSRDRDRRNGVSRCRD